MMQPASYVIVERFMVVVVVVEFTAVLLIKADLLSELLNQSRGRQSGVLIRAPLMGH